MRAASIRVVGVNFAGGLAAWAKITDLNAFGTAPVPLADAGSAIGNTVMTAR